MKKFLCIFILILTKIFGAISTEGQDEAGTSKGNKGKGPEPVKLPSSSDDESSDQQAAEGIPDYFAEVIAPDELEIWKKAFVGVQKDGRKKSSNPHRQNPNLSEHLRVEPLRMKNPSSRGGIHIDERPVAKKRARKLPRPEPILVQTDTQNFKGLVQQVTGLKLNQSEQQQMGIHPSMQYMPPSFARHHSHPPLPPNPLAQYYGHQQQIPIQEILNTQLLQNYLKGRLGQYGQHSAEIGAPTGYSHGAHQQIASGFALPPHFPFKLKEKQLKDLHEQQRQLVQAQQIAIRPDVNALLASLSTVEANLMGLYAEAHRLAAQLDVIYAELVPFRKGEKKLNEETVRQLEGNEQALLNQRTALTSQIAKLTEEKAQIKQQIFAKMPPPPPPSQK